MSTPALVTLCVVFCVVLGAAMFKLDSLVSIPKEKGRLPLAGGLDDDGMPIFLEPDGRPLEPKRGKEGLAHLR